MNLFNVVVMTPNFYLNTFTDCQCEQLKSRLQEIKSEIAEKNAKIRALELQSEADNFPLKMRIIDLEKSLDQLRSKVSYIYLTFLFVLPAD